MNKIYKVVFNKTLGLFVVASEQAKGHTKSKTVKSIAKALVVAVSAIAVTSAFLVLAWS